MVNPIFLETHWNYRNNLLFQRAASSAAAESQAWTLTTVALLAGLLVVIALARRAGEANLDKQQARLWQAMLAAGAVAVFMTTTFSAWLWKLPGLEFVMFPMRWLVMGTLAASLLLGLLLARWGRRGWAMALLMLALGMNLLLAGSIWGRQLRDAMRHRHQWQVDPKVIEAARNRSEVTAPPAWIPDPETRLTRPPQGDSPRVLVLPGGSGEAEVLEWTATRRSVRVIAEAGGKVELRTFYFPPWQCRSGGVELTVEPSPSGRLLVSVPRGQSEIQCQYTRPRSEVYGAYLSLAGLILVISLAGFEFTSRLRSTS